MTGDTDSIESLLRKDPDLLRCQTHYRTPLHFAVRENQIEAARLLLSHGALPTETKETGLHNGSLTMARDRGLAEMENVLNEHFLLPFGICEAGEELAESFRRRDAEGTKKLIERHGTEVADRFGNKPIHWATMTRQIEMIDLLIDREANIDAQRPDGAKPIDLTNGDYFYRGWRDLHPAAPSDHWAIMDHLLKKGAEYDLTVACRRNDEARVKEILASDPDAATKGAQYVTWYSGYPLRSAAKAGHLELVKLLLEHGADPNHAEHGLAPLGGSLYDAMQNGHLDVVRLLLKYGGNPNQNVESSGSVLFAAGTEEAKDLLRSHGAIYGPFGCCYQNEPDDFAAHCELDPHTANDCELFAMAAQSRFEELVSIFLKYQPDLWSRMPACLGKSPETTSWMVNNGMQINQTNWLGIHQLHRGASFDELAIWVELGVDLNIIDGEHQSTPLATAARRGDEKFAKELLEAGADPNLAGAEWAKPIHWANRRGHVSLAKMLKQYGAKH